MHGDIGRQRAHLRGDDFSSGDNQQLRDGVLGEEFTNERPRRREGQVRVCSFPVVQRHVLRHIYDKHAEPNNAPSHSAQPVVRATLAQDLLISRVQLRPARNRILRDLIP